MTVHPIPMSGLMRQVTVQVRLTGLKTARARLWLAAQIFRFGAFVGGFNVEIEEPET